MNKLKAASISVYVRWRTAAHTSAPLRQQAARGIAELVLRAPQHDPETPSVFGAALVASSPRQTAQATEPLSYVEARGLIAAIQWTGDGAGVRAVLTSGEVVDGKTRVRAGTSPTVDSMNDLGNTKDLRRRAPMVVNRRPGQGGHQLRGRLDVDATEGLDAYGEVTWRQVGHGATLGLIELDPAGNAIIAARLSSDDRDETLAAQVEPAMALAQQAPDVVPRLIVLAYNMSGTREVRGDREALLPAEIPGRDDLHFVDDCIASGWCQHIFWRDGDRIARDVIPGELILRRWKRNSVGLWLAAFGRKMNYETDRLALRATMMISAEERENITRRLQLAQINKGPLAGRGTLGSTRFGFVRDKRTKELQTDPLQWHFILRAFELASSGLYLDGEALSTREVAKVLAAEGCPFDHDRLLQILKDAIYVTGEFVSYVRRIPIAQRPIPLPRPVPIGQFQEVQDLLALRQGRTSRTPLGEFLLNYVEAVHARCEHCVNHRGQRALIKGYILPDQSPEDPTRKYRHTPFAPEPCKWAGYVWHRDELEGPIVAELRKLAEHPDLVRELGVAVRHQNASTNARLTDIERQAVEHEIAMLQQQIDGLTDEFLASLAPGQSINVGTYEALLHGLRLRIERAQLRLRNDEAAASTEAAGSTSEAERASAFLEIMTLETPDDPRLRALRARLFQRCVRRVIIDDNHEGEITITLEGHLVPEGADIVAASPTAMSADLLDQYLARKNGSAQQPPASGEQIETDLSPSADKSVSMLYGKLLGMPGAAELNRRRRLDLDDLGWRQRRSHLLGDDPSWTIGIATGHDGEAADVNPSPLASAA